MTLGEIRDWLKTLALAERCHIGRIDGARDRSLGVYARGASGPPVTALGGGESYGILPLRLLYHGTESARETEAGAAALWAAVARAARVDTPGGGRIQLIRPAVPAPVPLGSDPGGVYEYIIDLDIYYRRN